MRIAVIDYELCNPKASDYLCIRLCPINRSGKDCIVKKERVEGSLKRIVPVIDESLCTGCGICPAKCPTKAITIINTPESLKEKPIHRYGENEFALFRLPIPIKGVVGLLGPNGVGKTTALKILSGQLHPNLGSTKEAEWQDLIRMHRGSELQDYFERLSSKNIETVYKPQQLITTISKSAGDVLENCKESLIKDLELQNCLDRELKQLSGGELQRVVIAATVSKDADIYYIDEPSSYLDVKQRINVAKVLIELGARKNVMVVEHDLATLDLLAERIHIFYGAPGVYGIVSKPYSERKGINNFLGGFIAEDNVRIRDRTVFGEVTSEKQKKGGLLISFDNIHKKFDKFEMHIEKGELYKGETLGVFGANALGKTTFAKILAGEIEGLEEKIKISYKPQYLQSGEGKVVDILATEKNTGTSEFATLARQLEIERLFEKKMKQLSGGELQRIAIALCLARECDVYLLDEPSAYLDVDQRLAVASAIKNRTAIVIDHDLLFLSYISHRAMVFSGIPGVCGKARCMEVRDGFNTFLKEVGITFRKDPETKRPRTNKPGSVKDREQKESGDYFF